MTDEEKKVYEEAKLYLTHTGVDDFNLEKHQSENRIWAMDTLLNLIEKQQKEIERLEARKYILNAETGEISQIPINNNYISKNKIQSKIEELENEKEKYFEKQVIQHEIDVLQSLLEKE